ncbi:MAG: serine/threonine-protein kinase, partial [Myxococcota bacterium]
LAAFVAEVAEAAAKVALAAVQAGVARMALLEGCGSDADPAARHTAFRALRELDLALLESETLASLLGLGTRGDAGGALRPLANLFQRMTTWLLLRERAPLRDSELPHFTLRLRRLRALLHCVDADGRRIDDRGEVLRKRRFDVAQVLLRRTAADVPSGLRRAVSATTARAGDALVREEHVEVSDVVLAAASHVQRPEDAAAMGEASMVPEVRTALRAYARLASRVGEFPARGRPTAAALRSALEALIHLGHDLPIATSPRVEALRTTLHDLGFALETVAASGSLKELAEHTTGDTPLAQLERTATTLAKLVRGTRVRLGLDAAARAEEPSLGIAIRGLDLQLERSLRTPGLDLSQRLTAVARALRAELPPVFAAVAIGILARLVELPHDGPRRSQAPSLRRTPRETALPAWVPASRVLGGFYVKRAIGTGAAGSVFVATRAEARSDEHAERFALKTPDYSGAAARTLSESEFLRLFRQEAGTLLGLPAHENIARFVTFDAGARPKPILVMELVEGPNLERLLEGQDLDMDRALDLLEGIAKGLEAMHGAGVAHLDIKPSNIIVREAFAAATEGGPASAHPGPRREEPVLVDFGLAGKHLRPGCGTVHYGAPEIWGQDVSGEARPTPADVYAFGCLAYELMTGRTLFDDPNEVAVITAHLQHDGLPEPVSLLQQDDHTTGFAEIVRRCIRRDPRERVAMKDVVKALGRVRSTLKRRSWPLARADR